MKYLLIAFLFVTTAGSAQVPYNSALPNGYTKKAIVSEEVGLKQATITYHRPSVNGREGKVWGKLVHVGFIDQGFGNRNPAPWRAGANENTIIEFESDVKIEGQHLPKGKYGFFVAYGAEECTLIFSRNSDSWGSFFYDSKDDALRVKVTPEPLKESVENLKYEFTKQTPNAAVIVLLWEKLSIPFKVEVDMLAQQYEELVKELKNPRSFTLQALTSAAGWCLQNNFKLDAGLDWARLATTASFPGDPTYFPALATKANLLYKIGKTDEATSVIKTALPFGSLIQIQQLGRQLLKENKIETAFAVFEYNYNKTPDNFITTTGMARAFSASRDNAKALSLAKKALALAPNEANKNAVKEMIEMLEAGKDISR